MLYDILCKPERLTAGSLVYGRRTRQRSHIERDPGANKRIKVLACGDWSLSCVEVKDKV